MVGMTVGTSAASAAVFMAGASAVQASAASAVGPAPAAAAPQTGERQIHFACCTSLLSATVMICFCTHLHCCKPRLSS